MRRVRFLIVVVTVLMLVTALTSKKEVKLDKNVKIINLTDKKFLDTIVNVALQVEKISNINVVIMYLPEEAYIYAGWNTIIMASMVGKDDTYVLYVNPILFRSFAPLVVGHEITHLVQLYNRDLYVENDVVFWRGKEVDLEKVPYKERGWEIEAFNKQQEISVEIEKLLGE